MRFRIRTAMAISVFRTEDRRNRKPLPMTRFQRLKNASTKARTLYRACFCHAKRPCSAMYWRCRSRWAPPWSGVARPRRHPGCAQPRFRSRRPGHKRRRPRNRQGVPQLGPAGHRPASRRPRRGRSGSPPRSARWRHPAQRAASPRRVGAGSRASRPTIRRDRTASPPCCRPAAGPPHLVKSAWPAGRRPWRAD